MRMLDALLPLALGMGGVSAVSLGKYPPLHFYDRMALNDPGLEYSVYFPDPASGVNQTWGVRMNSGGGGEIRTAKMGSSMTARFVGTSVGLQGAQFNGPENVTLDYTADVGISDVYKDPSPNPLALVTVGLGNNVLDASVKAGAVTFTMKTGGMLSVIGANVSTIRHTSAELSTDDANRNQTYFVLEESNDYAPYFLNNSVIAGNWTKVQGLVQGAHTAVGPALDYNYIRGGPGATLWCMLPPGISWVRVKGPNSQVRSPFTMTLDPPPPYGPATFERFAHFSYALPANYLSIPLDPDARYNFTLSNTGTGVIGLQSFETFPGRVTYAGEYFLNATVDDTPTVGDTPTPNGPLPNTDSSGNNPNPAGQAGTQNSKVPIGAIVGAVVGGIAALCIVGALVFFWRKSRRLDRNRVREIDMVQGDVGSTPSLVGPEPEAAITPFAGQGSRTDGNRAAGKLVENQHLLAPENLSPAPSMSKASGSRYLSAMSSAEGSGSGNVSAGSPARDHAEDAGRVRDQLPPVYNPQWADDNK